MAERMKPVEAAKLLNIPPQRIYNLIKQNRVKTFSNPAGKVALIDLGEVKIVLSQVRTRGPHKAKTKGGGSLPGIRRGTILTHDRSPLKGAFARPDGGGKSVRTVTDPGRGVNTLVWLSDGTVETFWGTESLAQRLRDKSAQIESIPALLGMIMFQWRQEGHEKDAESLEKWALENEVGFYPINTPLVDRSDEEEPEPEPEEEVWEEVTLPVDLSKKP